MPVEFLTGEQAEAYGTFRMEPTRSERERFFFLDDGDRDLIALRRSDHHRLGVAPQICTVRYVGLFLTADPLDAPWSVVEYLAGQIGIEDPSCVKQYVDANRKMNPQVGSVQCPGPARWVGRVCPVRAVRLLRAAVAG